MRDKTNNMNGTIIDISGITVNVNTIDLEDSTDKASVLTIRDEAGEQITLNISYGKITEVCRSKH